MKHIILTGFMGSGKTTVGSLLAAQLNLPFIDSDLAFQSEKKLHPAVAIRRFGIASFRSWEKQFLRKILSGPPVVLGTGGGMVLDRQNRRQMLLRGFVIWLDAPVSVLVKRLSHPALRRLRPLLPKPFSSPNLRNLLEERRSCYEACHWRISSAYRSPETVAKEISRRYRRAI